MHHVSLRRVHPPNSTSCCQHQLVTLSPEPESHPAQGHTLNIRLSLSTRWYQITFNTRSPLSNFSLELSQTFGSLSCHAHKSRRLIPIVMPPQHMCSAALFAHMLDTMTTGDSANQMIQGHFCCIQGLYCHSPNLIQLSRPAHIAG